MTNLLSLRGARLLGCLGGALLAAHFAFAQTPDPLPSSLAEQTALLPLDDITERTVVNEHRPLKYQPIRESDILWEKRIWRIIDTREKVNLPFAAPEAPLFTILSEAVLSGDVRAYSTENDRFTKPLAAEEVRAMLFKRDTIYTIEEGTYEDKLLIVENELNWEDVRRYRIRESWFFDAKTSTLRVRILGIAPLVDVKDAEGNFLYEKPLFWVHYPSARPLLAGKKVVSHGGNYASATTWEDLFEMRYFASHIMKENNIRDMRLQDYLTGTDLLLQSESIGNALFNREQDMWSW
ncbi:MAG: hypothetical protein EPGJADBJ_04148 [Saprospiraceae bacterium]|nr:hypothetical protein [Saprospiraceae bacterium]